LNTVSGKPITIVAAFRLPLTDYQLVVDYCQKWRVSLSTATAALWKRELNNLEAWAEWDTQSKSKLQPFVKVNAWTDDEKRILIDNYPSSSAQELSLLLPGRSIGSIYNKAFRFNLKKETI